MSDSMKKRAPLTSQFVQHNKGGYNLRNRKKIKTNNNHDNDNVVDRLSALPDEVVVTIVSLLPLKEAAATSILSRRWRFLWASTMTLHFDDEKALRNLSTLFRKPEIQELEKCRYIDWVNSVVEKHKGPRVEQFRIAFDLDHNFSTSIDKWIQFTMKKGVQVLELDLLEYGGCFRKHGYTLTKEVLGIKAVEPLCYGIPSLHPSVCIGFKFLKVLHFKSVCVDGEVLEYLSSNCPALEQLSVLNSLNLRNLRVVGPSIALKYLVIEECDNIKSIEICDANLVLFVYSGFKINLLLRNVPLLVEVAVCMSDHSFRFGLLEVFFTQLSCCLSQLETLKLTRSVLRYKENHIFPRLANLKNLELTFVSEYDCSLLLLNSFMKASPLLRRLVLYFCYSSRSERRGIQYKKAAKFSHYYLKVVELIGYGRGITDFELVKYFVDNAVRLEKVIVDYDRIHPGKLYWCFPKHRIPESYEQKKRRLQDGEKVERVGLANHVGQRLRESVPSNIQLVCL